jgi:hypothetical protein
MSVTVNLRNNTDFYAKVDGIVDVINPNTLLEDKTIQWVSSDNKTIKFYSTEACDTTPICSGTISFSQTEGIKVDRGDITGTQTIKLDADCKSYRVIQESNEIAEKLIDWSEVGTDCVVNLSYFNIK